MFYNFRQNNSGGWFCHDAESGIGYIVCIEANSHYDANAKAEEIGLYFDGYGDCQCCGNRWDQVDRDDGTIIPTSCYYPEDIEEAKRHPIKGGWGIPSYIHYLDGRIEMIPC